jgi:hypothetical protein
VVGRTSAPVATGNKTVAGNGTAARAGIGKFDFLAPDTPTLRNDDLYKLETGKKL